MSEASVPRRIEKLAIPVSSEPDEGRRTGVLFAGDVILIRPWSQADRSEGVHGGYVVEVVSLVCVCDVEVVLAAKLGHWQLAQEKVENQLNDSFPETLVGTATRAK